MNRIAELKAQYAAMVSGYTDVVFFDTTNKVIRITEPTTIRKLYSLTMDKFDEMEYIAYANPMVAATEHYIKLLDGWSIEDSSKEMIREGSWAELGKIYSNTIAIGKV